MKIKRINTLTKKENIITVAQAAREIENFSRVRINYWMLNNRVIDDGKYKYIRR